MVENLGAVRGVGNKKALMWNLEALSVTKVTFFLTSLKMLTNSTHWKGKIAETSLNPP